ncbi:hypothetical protein [Azospirillum rugosum]|uniref:Uncharacterized protein n=1 Tax=Azospirillum rugosum TaxID=416170 RepID=A0ABS4SEP4_9PROT|nr:hypothetical protein [Azospirillum rugosum]MBP2291045.1 hypothetical protein [Azospirillum rugosum]MDQ0524891.1 hypothetical protein [Azospirillum rugosum]
MTMPISAAGLYSFDPIADALKSNGELLVAAEQSLNEAEAKATAAKDAATEAAKACDANPDDDAAHDASRKAAAKAGDLSADAETKRTMVETLRTILGNMEKDAEKRTLRPNYLLRPPTLRLTGKFDQLACELPINPSDRAMFRVMKEAVETSGGDYGITDQDPDFQALVKAFRESGGPSVPKEVAGLFEDLYTRVCDHPAVRRMQAQRKRYYQESRELKLKLHVAGVQGLPGGEAFAVVDSMATPDSIDLIPLDQIDSILAKIEELGTLRGREGNS